MFTWGDGEGGKLGLGDDHSNKLVPTLVRGELENKAVVQVAASTDHSACLTEDGSVYMWGSNSQGRLGIPSITDVADLPVLLQVSDLNDHAQSA